MSDTRPATETRVTRRLAWFAFALSFAGFPLSMFGGLSLRGLVWDYTPPLWWIVVAVMSAMAVVGALVLAFSLQGNDPKSREAVTTARIFALIAVCLGGVLAGFLGVYGDPL